jgi:hypothetical protein
VNSDSNADDESDLSDPYVMVTQMSGEGAECKGGAMRTRTIMDSLNPCFRLQDMPFTEFECSKAHSLVFHVKDEDSEDYLSRDELRIKPHWHPACFLFKPTGRALLQYAPEAVGGTPGTPGRLDPTALLVHRYRVLSVRSFEHSLALIWKLLIYQCYCCGGCCYYCCCYCCC